MPASETTPRRRTGLATRSGEPAGSLCRPASHSASWPPAEHENRTHLLSPIERLPLGVPQRLVCGAQDRIVPIGQARAYVAAARRAGDDVALELVEGAGHFELVDPASAAWQAVRAAVRQLLPPR